VILAGLILGAERGYIYVRHEYAEGIAKLCAAIRDAESAGVCGSSVLRTTRTFPVEVFVSPGGYICGEQSALIEVLEDKRAEPRNRPPELATNGLNDRPTLVNNVETLAWLPFIALKDSPPKQIQVAEPGASRGDPPVEARAYVARRLFSISGDVARPGVYELPVGAPLRELVMECAGGMRDPDQPLKAIAPSGPSGGFLPTRVTNNKGVEWDILDVPLEIADFRGFGSLLGAGLVVYDATRNLAEQALNCTEFYRNESCGKCVPCRIGSQKLVQIGQLLLSDSLEHSEREAQVGLVKELDKTLSYSSICGLGMVAPAPLMSAIRHFSEDFQRHDRAVGREQNLSPPIGT
jgi:NADH:ubiquinone oxidoreductase subunit F (NADH-binding)